MAYQQKLLMVCCLMITGLAALSGLRQHEESSAEANRQALTLDLLNIASRAQEYYHTPELLQGGQQSFFGLDANEFALNEILLDGQTENGEFKVLESDDQCLTIEAVGQHDADGDGQNFTILIKVLPEQLETEVLSL